MSWKSKTAAWALGQDSSRKCLGGGDIGNYRSKTVRFFQDGCSFLIVDISRRLGKIIADHKLRGFVYMKTSEELLIEAQKIMTNVVENFATMIQMATPSIKQTSRHLTDDCRLRTIRNN